MKHRLLHEFTREEIKIAFDQADVQQNGHLCVDELKNAIGYLNLHLPNRRIIESKHDLCLTSDIESLDFFSCQ
jgi:Ca2+-binding EF-hand superfamily protein